MDTALHARSPGGASHRRSLTELPAGHMLAVQLGRKNSLAGSFRTRTEDLVAAEILSEAGWRGITSEVCRPTRPMAVRFRELH